MRLYELINEVAIQSNVRVISVDDMGIENTVTEIYESNGVCFFDLPQNLDENVEVKYMYVQDDWLIVEIAQDWEIPEPIY